MFKSFFIFFAIAAGQFQPPPGPKIGVQNSILAKVNGTTISMIDVKKKMDLVFHRNYPNLAGSPQALYQFYETSWRPVLMEMIDQELILADAADRDFTLPDSIVRQEIENRFGPNVMQTLDQIGVSYEEAWRMIKNEIIVQQMNWTFIHQKAKDNVTPQDIRQSFQKHLKENPATTEFGYRVLSIRGAEPEQAQELSLQLQKSSLLPEAADPVLKAWEAAHPGAQCSLSTEYRLKEGELSKSHREVIASLAENSWSNSIQQTSRDNKVVTRIFYLSQKIDHPAPSFEEMAPMIQNELLQKATAKMADEYLTKLRKHYRFDNTHLAESLPEDYQPFSIQ